MRSVTRHFSATIFVVLCLSFAAAQTGVRKPDEANVTSASVDQGDSGATPVTPPFEPTVWIHLVGGRRMQVDDVTQTTDGVWYTRKNVSTFLEAASVTRIERSQPPRPDSPAAVVAGPGNWKLTDSSRVESFFMERFKRPLPMTAYGQSELHTRWGLDHRNGMDVGLHPDSVEGKALIKFLTDEAIPFLAFRSSVPGVATGPHIHVGKGSHRLSPR